MGTRTRRANTDQVAMTMGVLREIVSAARDGHFVHDVQYAGGADEYSVTYGEFRNTTDIIVIYSGDGTQKRPAEVS